MSKNKRIQELEEKATELYLNEIEWRCIIEMLSEEEQKEYWRLAIEWD